MSWSYKIIIAYAAFIIMIVSMVYVASKQTNEMQDENYYAKEIAYQSVIDGKNNLNALPQKVQVISHESNVEIQLPLAVTKHIKDGQVRFLRPSDQKKDVDVPLQANENGQQFLDAQQFSDGVYNVQISWKDDNKPYYYEDSVFIQRL